MKIYPFPTLYKTYPHLLQSMLAAGELSKDQIWIKLPDDFSFGENQPPKEAPAHAVANAPIIKRDWPLFLKALKLMAVDGDRGLGDIVERTIGKETSDAVKAWYKNSFGHDCGCSSRKDWLNRKYPL
jgi:hypothetical protein